MLPLGSGGALGGWGVRSSALLTPPPSQLQEFRLGQRKTAASPCDVPVGEAARQRDSAAAAARAHGGAGSGLAAPSSAGRHLSVGSHHSQRRGSPSAGSRRLRSVVRKPEERASSREHQEDPVSQRSFVQAFVRLTDGTKCSGSSGSLTTQTTPGT